MGIERVFVLPYPDRFCIATTTSPLAGERTDAWFIIEIIEGNVCRSLRVSHSDEAGDPPHHSDSQKFLQDSPTLFLFHVDTVVVEIHSGP